MIRSHRIRLNPTPEQAVYFAKAAGTRRFVFNWGLAEWQRQYDAGEKPSALALKKQFNAVRKEQFPWSYDVTKCVIEGAFMDLASAFKHFFEGIKGGRKVGFPKFKQKKHSREGFYLANDKFDVSGHLGHSVASLPRKCAHGAAKSWRWDSSIHRVKHVRVAGQ